MAIVTVKIGVAMVPMMIIARCCDKSSGNETRMTRNLFVRLSFQGPFQGPLAQNSHGRAGTLTVATSNNVLSKRALSDSTGV